MFIRKHSDGEEGPAGGQGWGGWGGMEGQGLGPGSELTPWEKEKKSILMGQKKNYTLIQNKL